ncbi:MAG: hypothetical protein HYZ07_02720 [Candidatus Harrisonbacteria bacterium]|nr:hypothetical protein [Candidatus Harrisonbacteria bacterium]MBI2406371.1 hypothetical protein [Candidatus Harrisonbacteria bacterium]MBI2603986.1 hypothetical protein [Candidatus Harrisonbacteria bacterium]MBI3114850.1 hypothetical protein [Candidatus Harrisonbacteria bacterium]
MSDAIVESSGGVKIATIQVSGPRIPADLLAKMVSEWLNKLGTDEFCMVSEAAVHFKAADGKITISIQR